MFYMPKGTIVELYNDTLHYAPIQITKKGYKVIVAVIHGTNAVLPEGVKSLNPRVVKCGKFQVFTLLVKIRLNKVIKSV